MNGIPRTLYAQIVLALFVGLMVAQGVGAWLMLGERARLGEHLFGAYAAQRIAGIINALDESTPAEQARLVAALSVPPTELRLDREWRQGADESDEAHAFVASVGAELARPLDVQILSIHRLDRRHPDIAGDGLPGAGRSMAGADDVPPPTKERHPGWPLLVVSGQAKLTNASILTFRHTTLQESTESPWRVVALLAVLGLSVAVLAAWAVRRLTRPLAVLSEAASGLAHNLDRAPLDEGGPLEVARAAQAFNSMQRDLRRYL